MVTNPQNSNVRFNHTLERVKMSNRLQGIGSLDPSLLVGVVDRPSELRSIGGPGRLVQELEADVPAPLTDRSFDAG
jgi:hypothetical protein